MIEVNLVPDIKQELIRAQRIRSIVIASSVVVGIVSMSIIAILAFYIFVVQAVRSNIADDAIKSGSAKLDSVKDLSKMLTIQNQLTLIPDLNSNKKIDSRVFDMLKSIIPPAPNTVKMSSVLVDSDEKSIKLEGQAQGGYAAVEVFKKTLEGASVKYTDDSGDEQNAVLASQIDISETSYGEDSAGNKVLRFTINFNYAEELLSPNSKNVSIVVTNSGNATDSYLGVPTSIFTKPATDIQEDK